MRAATLATERNGVNHMECKGIQNLTAQQRACYDDWPSASNFSDELIAVARCWCRAA